jgi:RecG-like helicase
LGSFLDKPNNSDVFEIEIGKLLSVRVSKLKGIGPQTEKSFSEIGISTLRDLLLVLPSKIKDKSQLLDLSVIDENEVGTFEVEFLDFINPVNKAPGCFRMRQNNISNLSIVYFGSLNLWRALAKRMKKGCRYWVFGKVVLNRFGEKQVHL